MEEVYNVLKLTKEQVDSVLDSIIEMLGVDDKSYTIKIGDSTTDYEYQIDVYLLNRGITVKLTSGVKELSNKILPPKLIVYDTKYNGSCMVGVSERNWELLESIQWKTKMQKMVVDVVDGIRCATEDGSVKL